MGTTKLVQAMESQLQDRAKRSSLRTLTITPPTHHDFSSNDFLSLSASHVLKTNFLTELSSQSSFRLGSSGSRLLDGNTPYHLELETIIAHFHNADSALLFNSGYDANSGFFACVPQEGDVVIFDEYIHASTREGLRLSRAGRKLGFDHNCVKDLRRKLEEILRLDDQIRSGERNIFVAVEGLYSMDGDLCPLTEIVALVDELLPLNNCHILVDEAHSNGIYGSQGRGLVCSLGLESKIFARLHTFGKALACNGATILCSKLTREYLINYARPLIYSTSMSFPSLAAIKSVYTLMRNDFTSPLILHLQTLINHLHTLLMTLPSHPTIFAIPSQKPNSPIFAIMTPSPRSLAKYCQQGGFMVRAIVAPTVKKGTERVRVCIHAGNTVGEIEGLVGRVREWVGGEMEKVGKEMEKARL